MGTGLSCEINRFRYAVDQVSIDDDLNNIVYAMKKRWTPLDALKNVTTKFTLLFIIRNLPIGIYDIPKIRAPRILPENMMF